MDDTHLLVSDVDDTLLGDDDALADFDAWYGEARTWLRLAYASGRFARSIAASVHAEPLPEPEAIIGGVGTEIVRHPSGMAMDDWPGLLARGWSPERVREALADVERLGLQPAASQSRFKISFFFESQGPGDLKMIRDLLHEAGLDADLIYSSDRDLDVVPRGVNKGSAATHLADVLGVPRERVLVSGNSANDAALFRPPFRGIVVANAHDELKALESESVYVSSHSFAAGVLDGIRHWTLRQREGR